MNCLDENVALSLLEGRLSPAKLAVVDAHLSSCDSCRELVAWSAGAVLSVTAPASAVPAPGLAPTAEPLLERGAAVGRYVVLNLVGRGGMGEVYAAFDPQLNRKVALKLITSDGALAGNLGLARRRLLREAKAIARLSHANIVVVHDAGAIDGRVFIAMEFVEGQTLNEWIGAQPHSWREIVDVFLAAGRGLVAAHAAGLVHRDFKPQNVMVAVDGNVRVMDFGIASASEADNGHAGATADGDALPLDIGSTVGPAMTRTGMMLGTPAYMAPEQFLAEPADARSDQFSFGVALYEALYGERPFEGATVAELTRTVTTGRLREPPARSRVPARLRRILTRALRRERQERFSSMEALLDELARDPERRRRRVAVAVGVALALVVVGAGAQRTIEKPGALCRGAGDHLVGVWELSGKDGATPRRDAIRLAFSRAAGAAGATTWERASATIDRYARDWTAMSTASCEATHLRGEQSASVLDLRTTCLGASLQKLRALTDVFTMADPDVVERAVDAANALPDLSRCADIKALIAVTPPPADPGVRATVEALRRRVAEVDALRETGKMAAALPLARRLVVDARALGYDPTLAEALELGCGLEDRKADQIAYCEEGVWASEASRDDEDGARMTTELVGLTSRHSDESREWAGLAKAILKRMGPGHEKLEGWLAQDRANAAYEMGDVRTAKGLYERAIALKTAAEGAEHADVARSLMSYGSVLHDQGDHEGGLAMLARAETIFERAYGPSNRYVAMALNNEGEVLNTLSRAREALAKFDKAIAILSRDVAPKTFWIAYPLTGKGRSLLALGHPGEAVAPLSAALEVRDRGETLPLPRGETRFALARALWESGGDRTRARALATSARDEYRHATSAAKNVAEIDAWLAKHRRG